MAQTPSGRRLRPFLGPLRNMVVFAASVINRLPESWVTSLLQMFLSKNYSVKIRAMEFKYIAFACLFHFQESIETWLSMMDLQRAT